MLAGAAPAAANRRVARPAPGRRRRAARRLSSASAHGLAARRRGIRLDGVVAVGRRRSPLPVAGRCSASHSAGSSSPSEE